MPKAKTARLSLTLPGPLDGNNKSPESGPAVRRNSYDRAASIGIKGAANMGEALGPAGRNGAQTPEAQDEVPAEPRSPQITSLPQMPMSAGRAPHTREQSRSLLGNLKAAKSSAKIPGSEASPKPGDASAGSHDGRPAPAARKPSLAGLVTNTGGAVSSQEDLQSPMEGLSGMSIGTIQRQDVYSPSNLQRAPYSSPSLPRITDSPQHLQNPAKKGRGFGFMRRNASHQSQEFNDDNSSTSGSKPQSRDRSGQRSIPPAQTSNATFNPLAANNPQHLVEQRSGFFKALRTGANKTMLGMKKQRDKMTKSQGKPFTAISTTPRANPDYQYKIIYAPLLDQVRQSRIAPRLEMSRDKTEFWLPALPWRCIDYLNYKGVEEEGIYRHSGSLQHVNYYKQKFDREGDVNLYEEQDLYDVNVIASLLKAWLRDLPEPVFPSHLQTKLVEHHDSPHAPEELKQVISSLAPWQYYLLFAITCHLSLIAGSAEKNKMRIDNLFTCIGSQALKLDAHVFGWLVGDWRNCWMGCTDEKVYLEAEYTYLDEVEREAAETASQADDLQPPSSSRSYADSTYHISSPAARPNVPRPFAENDGRPGSSRSQNNLRPAAPSYQISPANDSAYDSAPGSAHSSGHGSTRATGSRKTSQTEIVRPSSDQRNQIQVQNHQPRAPSPLGRRNRADTGNSSRDRSPLDRRLNQDAGNTSRERSPLGRRPARAETGADGRDRETRSTSGRRAQSQPRSDTSRGKSPSGQGRRRPRGETTSGSPSNRSPSVGSDQLSEKAASGRRRREGNEPPEMPTLQKEQRERYEHLTSAVNRSRKASETRARARSSTDDTRRKEKRREEPEAEPKEHERTLTLEQLDIGQEEAPAQSKHQRKGSKFRLSEQTFPEPISPTWKGF